MKEMKIKMKKFLNSKYLKLLFSIAIIGASIPSIYQDFTYGHGGVSMDVVIHFTDPEPELDKGDDLPF